MLWLILGLVIGAGAVWIAVRSRNNDEMATPWYGWVLGILALLFGLLAIEVFVNSLAELESQAAWMGLAAFGVPALILGALAWWLPHRLAHRDGAGDVTDAERASA